MKRFATVLLLSSLALCGCPEKKAAAPDPAATTEEAGDEAEGAAEDTDKTAEEMAEDKEEATKEGTDKARKAIGNVLGD